MHITSQLEYDAAMLLIQDLSGAPEATPEERVLIRTILAVEIWEVGNTRLGDLDSGWSPDQRPMPTP